MCLDSGSLGPFLQKNVVPKIEIQNSEGKIIFRKMPLLGVHSKVPQPPTDGKADINLKNEAYNHSPYIE